MAAEAEAADRAERPDPFRDCLRTRTLHAPLQLSNRDSPVVEIAAHDGSIAFSKDYLDDLEVRISIISYYVPVPIVRLMIHANGATLPPSQVSLPY